MNATCHLPDFRNDVTTNSCTLKSTPALNPGSVGANPVSLQDVGLSDQDHEPEQRHRLQPEGEGLHDDQLDVVAGLDRPRRRQGHLPRLRRLPRRHDASLRAGEEGSRRAPHGPGVQPPGAAGAGLLWPDLQRHWRRSALRSLARRHALDGPAEASTKADALLLRRRRKGQEQPAHALLQGQVLRHG